MTNGPKLTPSQTVGPFFHPALLRVGGIRENLAESVPADERITIYGRVCDSAGDPVTDAAVEIWQADGEGRYADSREVRSGPEQESFIGYGRSGTDDQGYFRFTTIKPGPVRFDEHRFQAPHVCVTVYARGLLNHLVTRIYFEDEPANESDPILQLVPSDRRGTLIACREKDESAQLIYRFDVILQGDGETVFFNV